MTTVLDHGELQPIIDSLPEGSIVFGTYPARLVRGIDPLEAAAVKKFKLKGRETLYHISVALPDLTAETTLKVADDIRNSMGESVINSHGSYLSKLCRTGNATDWLEVTKQNGAIFHITFHKMGFEDINKSKNSIERIYLDKDGKIRCASHPSRKEKNFEVETVDARVFCEDINNPSVSESAEQDFLKAEGWQPIGFVVNDFEKNLVSFYSDLHAEYKNAESGEMPTIFGAYLLSKSQNSFKGLFERASIDINRVDIALLSKEFFKEETYKIIKKIERYFDNSSVRRIFNERYGCESILLDIPTIDGEKQIAIHNFDYREFKPTTNVEGFYAEPIGQISYKPDIEVSGFINAHVFKNTKNVDEDVKYLEDLGFTGITMDVSSESVSEGEPAVGESAVDSMTAFPEKNQKTDQDIVWLIKELNSWLHRNTKGFVHSMSAALAARNIAYKPPFDKRFEINAYLNLDESGSDLAAMCAFFKQRGLNITHSSNTRPDFGIITEDGTEIGTIADSKYIDTPKIFSEEEVYLDEWNTLRNVSSHERVPLFGKDGKTFTLKEPLHHYDTSMHHTIANYLKSNGINVDYKEAEQLSSKSKHHKLILNTAKDSSAKELVRKAIAENSKYLAMKKQEMTNAEGLSPEEFREKIKTLPTHVAISYLRDWVSEKNQHIVDFIEHVIAFVEGAHFGGPTLSALIFDELGDDNLTVFGVPAEKLLGSSGNGRLNFSVISTETGKTVVSFDEELPSLELDVIEDNIDFEESTITHDDIVIGTKGGRGQGWYDFTHKTTKLKVVESMPSSHLEFLAEKSWTIRDVNENLISNKDILDCKNAYKVINRRFVPSKCLAGDYNKTASIARKTREETEKDLMDHLDIMEEVEKSNYQQEAEKKRKIHMSDKKAEMPGAKEDYNMASPEEGMGSPVKYDARKKVRMDEAFLQADRTRDKVVAALDERISELEVLKNGIQAPSGENEMIKEEAAPSKFQSFVNNKMEKASKAKPRIYRRRVMAGVKAAVIKVLESRKEDTMVINFASSMMETELGEALLMTILGNVAPTIPMLKKYEVVHQVAEEMEVEAMAIAGDQVLQQVQNMLMPVFMSALEAIQEVDQEDISAFASETNKVRIDQPIDEPIEEEPIEGKEATINFAKGKTGVG